MAGAKVFLPADYAQFGLDISIALFTIAGCPVSCDPSQCGWKFEPLLLDERSDVM